MSRLSVWYLVAALGCVAGMWWGSGYLGWTPVGRVVACVASVMIPDGYGVRMFRED